MARGILTSAVIVMFNRHDTLLEAFEEACPKSEGRTAKATLDDRREMFWRLADNDECLVYAEEAVDVTNAEMGENTFVDHVLCYWRPEGEHFVMALVNTGIGEENALAFLSTATERPL